MGQAGSSLERRRAARFTTHLQVVFPGINEQPTPREVNISASGIYIGMDISLGAPGDIVQLLLQSLDGKNNVLILARIVRTVTVADMMEGEKIVGVAFAYLLSTHAHREAVATFLRYVVQQQVKESVAPIAVAKQVTLEHTPKAMLTHVGVHGMVLETDWPCQIGDPVRCVIEVPHHPGKVILEGKVSQSQSMDRFEQQQHYKVEVLFAKENEHISPLTTPIWEQEELYSADEPPSALTKGKESHTLSATPTAEHQEDVGHSIHDALDQLLAEMMAPPDIPPPTLSREHLRGNLARIRLSSLLHFLDLERLTGELVLHHQQARGIVHVREGRIIDCQLIGETSPLVAMEQLLSWQEGQFEFHVGAVPGQDKVGMATTHLLLKLTSEQEQAPYTSNGKM